MISENSYAKNESISIKIILCCILIASFSLVLRNLGHSKIHFWDEGFHAIVARNLTKHPLKFTLYDQPWLQYDYKSWGENHIWLHKPPVAMWKICVSHFIFGINAFALRLPSAISLVLCAWLTYRIASDLFDKRVGLIAAFLQAFNPFLFASVHGYRFSDHIDIALLLWVQVSCWFLLRAVRTGKRRNYILSGVAMGIAYLSKSYLALIIFGIAFVVWFVAWYKRKIDVSLIDLIVRRFKWIKRRIKPNTDNVVPVETQKSNHIMSDAENMRIRLKDVGLLLLVGIGTVAPWAIYCLIRYPKEYMWEHRRVLEHLNTNIEGWKASWDRPLFEYMPLFYPFFYAALFAIVLCLLVVMFKRWRLPELFVLAWAIGVIVPHTLAQTKTPSATMIAVPALLICLAAVITQASQQKDWLYTSIWGASMFSIFIIATLAKRTNGHVRIRNVLSIDWIKSFAPFMHRHFWIIEQIIGFGVLLGLFTGVYFLIRQRDWQRWIWLSVRYAALVITIFYTVSYVEAAYKVTQRNEQIPLYVVSGKRIQQEMPKNVCFFLDDERTGAHFDLMYYADRSTYQINNVHAKAPRNVALQAREARAAGAIPYLFSVKETEYSYPLLMEGEVDIGNNEKRRYRIYEITETQ